MEGATFETVERSAYTRTSGDLLVNDDGPSSMPFVYWTGIDSGGLAQPIGPNGPWSGSADAQPIVTRATSLIVGPLTAAPFKVLDSTAPARVLAAPRWITDPMLVRPDERFPASAHPAVMRLTRSKFWGDWIRSAIWWGLGVFVAQEDASGQPVAGSMRLLNPLMVSTTRDRDGVIVWALGTPGNAESVVFDRDGRAAIGGNVWRIHVLRNPYSPVDADGYSKGVFAMHPGAFKLGAQIESYTAGTFRSGIPAGYLKVHQPHLSQEGADALKAKWLENHGGDRRSIAVLNATTEFVPLNLSPVDAALAEVKRLAVADVAMAFALDPMNLGAPAGSGTYSNIRDGWKNHREFGVSPWQVAAEEVLSALLPASQTVRVDLSDFASPDPAEQSATDRADIDAGILTVDEVRARRGLPPLPKPAQETPDPDSPPKLASVETEEDDDDAA